VGPIAPSVAAILATWQVAAVPELRDPLAASESDLSGADLIIALKETEHRPMAEQYFPAWVDRMRYWQIDDVDCAPPEVALERLAAELRSLVDELPEHRMP